MMKEVIVSSVLAMLLTGIVVTAAEDEPESASATETKQEKTMKILGLGNSYLINVANVFPGVVKAAGHDLVLFKAAPGGCTLQRHYDMAMLNEEDPQDPAGKPYFKRDRYGKRIGDGMSLRDVLTSEKWEYVTIQQSSPNSFKIETYRPYARNLYDYIKEYAPQAEVVFHQAWPWREDIHRQNMHLKPKGYMHKGLTKCYYTIAKELGIRIIPVGNAFQLAAETPEWKFQRDPDFDYENPKYPDLPKEKNSLNRGFRWSKRMLKESEKTADGEDKDFEYYFRLDGSHAAGPGAYLAACVWFEFFYGEDVTKIQSGPGYLGERAASLREIAHKVVTEGVRPEAWPEELEP